MRRRRPAPLAHKDTSVVPLPRANATRKDADDASTPGAAALERRDGTRSRFGELTPTTGTPSHGAPGSRPHTGGSRAPARARRASAARVPHDGWTFVLIPPGADARPRTLRVSVRRLRFAVVTFCIVVASTLATGGLLVLALSFLPPAQDETRGVELGVFASAPTDAGSESAKPESITTSAGIAAASAGAAAPRGTASRPRATVRSAAGGESDVSPSIMESLPVVGEITSRFARARRHPLLGVVRRHAGIDIAAAAGTHITAPAGGRVSFSGRRFGYGYTVEIDHGNGVTTRYAHCRTLMVRAGDEVAQGAVIATVGRSGLATAPHLHYEVLVRGRNVNPLRTPLASLLDGKLPPPAAAPQRPTDSTPRTPPTPDAAVPDVPDVPDVTDVPQIITLSTTDTIALAPPTIARRPTVTTHLPSPSALPFPAASVRDTARKS